jgi:hypothetical protein
MRRGQAASSRVSCVEIFHAHAIEMTRSGRLPDFLTVLTHTSRSAHFTVSCSVLVCLTVPDVPVTVTV